MAIKRTAQTDQLASSILTLTSPEECYRFLEDICTIKEIYAISQRLEVARVLAEGESYQHTQEKTGASSATISRVKRCLDYGSGGYTRAIASMEDDK